MCLLENMSVPPRSQMSVEMDLVGSYTAFCPSVLAEKLGVDIEHLSQAAEKIAKDGHIVNLPRSYMIGFCFKDVDGRNGEQKLLSKHFGNKFTICEDVELIIAVMAKSVNDIYVPERPFCFYPENFRRLLCFCLDDGETKNEQR